LRHYEKSWPIEELCELANLEKSQFYAYYQKFFRSTPHADLMQVRLEKAKNLLTNEAVAVSEVAQRCGFLNLSHFSRCFKRECGAPPKEYRAKKKRPRLYSIVKPETLSFAKL
ncbi:MAG: AraC family transcriptional regulator, partial [Hungatella sp.]